MNAIVNFIQKHADEIIVGIIIVLASGLCLASFKKITDIIKKITDTIKGKNPPPPPLQEPKDEAVYLNKPRKCFDSVCAGRDELLEKACKKIKDKENLFKRKCIAITGEEGIGKTLFCYTLFQYHLKEFPIYLGWIECNGKQSVFDAIRTFDDSRFYMKSKDAILNAFSNINKPCILFADNADQYTPLDELEELSHCRNVILIVSGLLKEIGFADYTFTLPDLSKEVIYAIFKKHSGEDVDLMIGKNRKCVQRLLNAYVKGNPFLAAAFAKAKDHYNGRWDDVLKNMEKCEYTDGESYLKDILQRLYKVKQLNSSEKDALSKLSAIEYTNFVKAVFEWLDIPYGHVKCLCNTYWLAQEDGIMYSMDMIHRDVIIKVFKPEDSLENTIRAITLSLSKWGSDKDNGFRWIAPYIEDVLKKVQGYAAHIMDEDWFSKFSYQVAAKYEKINDKEKRLKWIELCNLKNKKSEYKKRYMELRAKSAFIGTLFSYSEIKMRYSELWTEIKIYNDDNEKRSSIEEYCFFLIGQKQYKDAISCCQKYFETYDFDLSNEYDCDMFCRYLQAANLLDDEETLKAIISDAVISDLYQNDRVSIAAAWIFGELGLIYAKWGDKESSDRCLRHMTVLLNEERCFFHDDIKEFLKISDEEFAEYMHSCDELRDSLEDALQRGDAEALYIEGRYKEKYGHYDDAFALYEEAAAKDSLRGICSLALLYYRGQGESRNYDKARKYWEYCCERGHRGSHYWLGMLLLDRDYHGNNKELASQNLTKAAELGSERAKQKLSELQPSFLDNSAIK